MSWVSRHVVAVALIGVAVAAMGGMFAFARPTFHPYVMPTAPNDLPYTAVTYTAADASRAFAEAGVKTRAVGPRATRSYPMTDLSNKGLTVVVTAFGDPTLVKDSGYSRYYTFVGGHWVNAPRTCSAGAANAERWRGNIRVIVSCTRAGGASGAWLRRVTLALSRL
ncbi:MAG TPA: hypothetical protein VGO31_06640 [Microbacteriaceae bacterium]|nr:hypothetical protein [Microbacteriaceae bacterium]